MKNAWRLIAAALAAALTFTLAGFALAAVQAPAEHSVKGAIVNLDEGVELEGQWVPMGRQLAAEMVLQDGPFEWEVSTPVLAAEGLEDNRYRVVVTIPEDFSAAVTSLAAGGDVVQAQVQIEARPGADRDQAMAAELVTRAAAIALGGQISEEFVVALIGGLGEMGTQLGEAADGAGTLADGTEELADGTAQLADGAAQLDDGMAQAAAGFGELVGGVGQLEDGAQQAAGGVGALADGTSQLVVGVGQSAEGASQLAGGVGELAAGTTALAGGLGMYVEGVGELADGMSEYAQGSHQYADGINQLVGAVDPALAGVLGTLAQISAEIEGAADALLANPEFNALVAQIASISNQIGQACLAEPSAPLCQQFTEGQLLQMADPNLAQVITAQVIGKLNEVLPVAEAGVGAVTEQVAELRDGINALGTGATELALGADSIAAGAHVLADEGQALVSGMYGLAGGAEQLADGTGQLASGLATAANESTALVDGAYAAADGVGQLAGGIGELRGGAGEAAAGLGMLSDGMRDLATGTGDLSQGAGQLSDGTRELADGLGQAVDLIPTYTEAQARDMAMGITQPIDPPSVEGGMSARAAAAVALLLWMLAFLLAWIYPVFSRKVSRSVQPSWRLAASTWWKPAAWMAGIGAILGFAFGNWAGVSLGATAVVGGLGLLVGVVFASVQQALAGALGLIGRVLALAMFGVAAIAAATAGWGTPLAPLASILPTGLAAGLLNAVVIPGIGTVAAGLVGLIFWMLGAYALAIWATASRRAKPADQSLEKVA